MAYNQLQLIAMAPNCGLGSVGSLSHSLRKCTYFTCGELSYDAQETIWKFPKIGVSPSHPFSSDCPLLTNHFGYPPYRNIINQPSHPLLTNQVIHINHPLLTNAVLGNPDISMATVIDWQ